MEKLIEQYSIININLDNDGHIGIPANLTVLFDKQNHTVVPGYRKTPIIIYVLNTNTARIGKESDEDIISRMLSLGYVVVILDYMNSALACPPSLDYSIQSIRRRIINGEFFKESDVFPVGKYSETIVVPSGYDVLYNKAFFAFDKHGADGDFEKIVEIWNNDFRGTNSEKIIKWTNEVNVRKETQNGHDGTEPQWYDSLGNPSDTGEYIKIKHTKAQTITDCVKPDGSPIELNLYMHVIYPTLCDTKVPVMCLANSSEDLASGSATADRPHLIGFLFRGYAAVMYDYGYTPMARLDSYGYFDGFPKPGYITGDNPTYSMQYYDDKRINTAAMRFIRYLSLSDENLPLDINAIGVYGNSKGAWNTFLGERNPEKMQSKRMHKGHHDETRFENGKTTTEGIIRGGEEQPWLSINGVKISGEANLLYSSCGGVDDAITSGHAPTFISCNRRDSSCYSTSNSLVNVCKTYNVPTMWFEIPLAHTLTYGNDLIYGADTYTAFFDFAGYYLKNDAVKVVAAKLHQSHFPIDISVKFSGAIDIAEIKKITVKNNDGKKLTGTWKGIFGGVEWLFVPNNLEYGRDYTLVVPKNLKGINGKALENEFSYKFKSPDATITDVEASLCDSSLLIEFTKNCTRDKHYLAIEIKNGANCIGVYTKDNERIATLNIAGNGIYKIDISDYIASLPDVCKVGLVLKSEFAKADHIVFSESFTSPENSKISDCEETYYSITTAPDGTAALKIDGLKTITCFPTEEFYCYPKSAFKCSDIIKDTPITKEDLGREFRISMRIFDTVSRYIRIELNHLTSREHSISDYNRSCYNIRTKEGEWTDFEFDYKVYEPIFKDIELPKKELIVSMYGHGNKSVPIYFADIKVCESISDIEISDIWLISSEESCDLPDGQSDIVCPEAPWLKTKTIV